MQITFSEKELEDFLCKDGNLQKYLGLKFIARQVNIDPMGIIDILAFSKSQKCWVIVELKKDFLDKDSIIQGLSYLNFYKTVSNYKDREINSSKRAFKLLLIGQNIDSSIKKTIHHYHHSFSECWDIYYTLFSIQFDKGIDFSFQNKSQRQLENKIHCINGGKNFCLSLSQPILSRCSPKL